MMGSCLCGAVVFEVGDIAGPFELCHCRRCRKASGSAYAACLDAKTEGYRLVRGKDVISSFEAPILERPPAYQVWFCSKCGSQVPDPEPSGERVEIPAGALDDTPPSTPDKHIYVDLKAEWDEIDEILPRFTRDEIRAFRRAHGRVAATRSGGPVASEGA